MKHLYFDKYWLIAIVMLFFCNHLFAADLITEQVVINLESAGTLPNKISDTDKNLITNLKVIGDLNGTDVLFIREMAGRDVNGDITRGKLTTLDLGEANIVAGGDAYYTAKNEIKSHLFESTKIESIILPASVQTLGYSVFQNCQSLQNIKFPNNLKSINSDCFNGCTSLKSIKLPNSITSIESSTFSNCTSLKSIELPNSVTSIESSAFSNCTSLQEINLPKELSLLESYAFYNCTSLTSINIPKTIGHIKKAVFANCSALTSIILPSKLISIQSQAFLGCRSLVSIDFPEDLVSIGDEAFLGCNSLVTIRLPKDIISIGYSAFQSCSSLESITLPDNLEEIKNSAFWGCVKLKSITIPKDVTTIEYDTFSNCLSLTTVTLSEKFKTIGRTAFDGCSSLTSINLPNGLETIESCAFRGCSALKSITIPEGITTVKESTFSGCSSLISVTLPNSLETFESTVFWECGLETITIPAKVTQIGMLAFGCCASLSQIISLAKKAPTIIGDLFINPELYDQVCLTVPVGATGYAEGEWAKLKRIASPTVCELTDDNSTITPATYASGNLSYSRSGLKAGNYATFCLPFETNLSDVADAFDNFYTTNGTALCKPDGMLMLMLKSIGKDEVIPAGQPFLAKVSGTASTVTFKNAKMKIIETEQATNPEPISLQIYDWNGVSGLLTENNSLKVSFGGTLTTTTGEGTKLESFNTDGSFGPAKNGVLKPFRSFVSKENAAAQFMIKSISIGLEDGNKIISVSHDKEKNTDNCVYTIDGRLINATGSLKNLPSGIYILNGKKISIK